jgi:aspartate carbamoyltransferase catalytic subunit
MSSAILSDPASYDAGFFLAPGSIASRRHLLGLDGMSRDSILELLECADRYRRAWRSGERYSDELRGVEVCNAFFEDSTRTRVSFELAAKRLGATTVTTAEAGSSISKGETLLDTLRTVVAMGVSLVVVRHRSAGLPAYLARFLDAGVINAGDGEHEHPTQGLLDLLTLQDAWRGRFEGRRMALIGDIAHSRVARSAIFGLTTLGTEVVIAGPPALVPRSLEALGCRRCATVEEALAGADAAMTLRLQRERMEPGLLPPAAEYARHWGIDERRVGLMRPEAVVMHPGPMNRGIEIAPAVADGPRSRILTQVENGVAIRCAVLSRLAQGALETVQ